MCSQGDGPNVLHVQENGLSYVLPSCQSANNDVVHQEVCKASDDEEQDWSLASSMHDVFANLEDVLCDVVRQGSQNIWATGCQDRPFAHHALQMDHVDVSSMSF